MEAFVFGARNRSGLGPKRSRMPRTKTRADAALEIWDYFYIRNVPAPGDEKAWGVIERATCRIRESEPYLDPPFAPDVRVRSARRIRDAARRALQQIEQLSVVPERWVIDELADLEVVTICMIEALSNAARNVVVH
jgi:hypothetical protein